MTTFEPEFPSTFSQENSPHHLVSTRSGKVTLSVPNRKDNQMENESQRGNQNRTLDRSSFSIARNLAEIKEKRKLMESNAQLLFNRLQALSSEEYKLKRNTLDLKKKSQELLKHRLSRDKQVKK